MNSLLKGFIIFNKRNVLLTAHVFKLLFTSFASLFRLSPLGTKRETVIMFASVFSEVIRLITEQAICETFFRNLKSWYQRKKLYAPS